MAKKWIQGAIKHPGALHKELHVKEGTKIPKSKLEAAAHKPGKLGERARLAETLEGFHHEGKSMKHEHECSGKHCKHSSHKHEGHRDREEHKEHRKHMGKHAHGRHSSPEKSEHRKSPAEHKSVEGPIKVPKSDPWPNESYVGRGHTGAASRSNMMMSRHEANHHIKTRK